MKKKIKLRYLYRGGASMNDFYNVPVIGIEFPGGLKINSISGSDENVSATQALTLAKNNACSLLSQEDFLLIRKRAAELRAMLAHKINSPILLSHDLFWVKIAESESPVAFSLASGLATKEKAAAVIIKY